MIIDASALLAIALAEPDARRYARIISRTQQRRVPTVTWFEATMRIDAMGDADAVRRFNTCIDTFRIEVLPFTSPMLRPLGLDGSDTGVAIIPPASISAIAWSMASRRSSANRSCSRATISPRPISNPR